MSNWKIWIIPGLLVILTLGGLFYFRGQLPEDTLSPQVTQEVEEQVKPRGFAKPVEPETAAKISQDSQALTGALHSGDLADCAKITWDQALREQCEDNLNFAAIIKSGNEASCDKLSNEELKVQCHDKIYLTAAVDEKNLSVCEKIADASLKQMCIDQVQMILGRYANSIEDCAGINSEILQKQCEDNFHVKMSAKTLSLENCDNISDSNLSSQCRQTVTKNLEVIEQSKQAAQAATVTRTFQEILALCDELSEGRATACKDAVYPQLAFDEKDLTYCDRVSDDFKASECRKEQGDRVNEYYLRQSLASNNRSLCQKISDPELQELCLNS